MASAVVAVDRRERHRPPPLRAGGRLGKRVACEPADIAGLERMRRQLTAGGRAVEQQHVHPEPAEPHPLTVDHAEQTLRVTLDPGLLADLLHRDLGRRVADVGPAGRIQPDPGVLALHEQDLAALVADDRADRHLGRDVAGHALADRVHPLADEVVGLALHGDGVRVRLGLELARRGLDVAGDVQDLLVPLPLVEVLGEPHAGAGDRRQRLAPSRQISCSSRSRRAPTLRDIR